MGGKLTAFTTYELERALSTGNDHPDLNNENIARLVDEIFKGKKIDKQYYQQTIVGGNYHNFDLDVHGAPLLLQHIYLLIQFFSAAAHVVNQSGHDAERILDVGCGTGRLATSMILLAKIHGVKEVIFNDLFEEHTEATRERLQKCFNTSSDCFEGVKTQFVNGDFTESISPKEHRSDILISNWFASSEVADYESVEKLKETRKRFYDAIAKNCSKGGVFIESVPESQIAGNYYHLQRAKVYAVMKEKGIMEGENHNIAINDYTHLKQDYPYHIRYIPAHREHVQEITPHGFSEVYSHVGIQGERIKSKLPFWNFYEDADVRSILELLPLEEVLQYFVRHINESILTPKISSPYAKLSRTTVWQKEG